MWAGRCAVVMVAAGLGLLGTARADVCVGIDTSRDSLAPAEQMAVRVAIEGALEREGVAIDRRGGRCPPGAGVSAYAIHLGDTVTVTIIAGTGAGAEKVTGRAANLDEVDLLVSQLIRSLVTGRSLATGSGVTDRTNVLRDQVAPRRADPSTRRWDQVVAIGGGMLQLPALDERPRQRQFDVVSIESRWWGFSGEDAAFELYGRILVHDYAAIGAADDAYDRAKTTTTDDTDEEGRFVALIFSPFAVANYDAGLGIVAFLGGGSPRPFVRLGATVSLLSRFSDPDHYFDVGFGGYAGVGLQVSSSLNLSVAANVSNPVVHNWMASGYWYFLTTTAMLEYRRRAAPRRGPRFVTPEPVPVIRRINE